MKQRDRRLAVAAMSATRLANSMAELASLYRPDQHFFSVMAVASETRLRSASAGTNSVIVLEHRAIASATEPCNHPAAPSRPRSQRPVGRPEPRQGNRRRPRGKRPRSSSQLHAELFDDPCAAAGLEQSPASRNTRRPESRPVRPIVGVTCRMGASRTHQRTASAGANAARCGGDCNSSDVTAP